MIGDDGSLPLPMEGSLPPDLQGTLVRVGPRGPVGGDGAGHLPSPAESGGDGGSDGGAGQSPGALHAVELRDGQAVWYRSRESDADAGVFWHAGSILALPESGLPSRYTRFLEPQEFAGGLTVPIASHVHRVASDGSRVLFSVDDGTSADAYGGETGAGDGVGTVSEPDGIWLRIGEWDAGGGLRHSQSVELERATWQHDVAVTANFVVFIESPTTRVAADPDMAVPFGWVPGSEGWLGIVPREGDGTVVRWFRLDPCLVTHVLGAYEEDTTTSGGADATRDGAIVLYVCRYAVPEPGQPVDLAASVVAPRGIGLSAIGGSLPVLERWRVTVDALERTELEERHVEYPRIDAFLEGAPFRYGYGVELDWEPGGPGVVPVGVVQFDLARDDVRTWAPGPGRRASEPLFVRAADGHADDEGWLLTIVDDADRGASDLYVLDASSLGHRPEAVIHLPERLPFRSHGEWVPADRYR